jgi:hypothetical protein
MAEPEEVKSYFTLEFGTDEKGNTEIKAKGPEIPNTQTSPTIKLYKKNGKYAFEIGIEVHEIDVNEVGEKFKAYFGEASPAAGLSGLVKIRMPDRWDLARGDGTYLSFDDYERKVKNYEVSAGSGIGNVKFLKLPRPVYNSLVWYYRTHDNRGNPWFL